MEEIRSEILKVWSEEERVKGLPLTTERKAWLATQVVLSRVEEDKTSK